MTPTEKLADKIGRCIYALNGLAIGMAAQSLARSDVSEAAVVLDECRTALRAIPVRALTCPSEEDIARALMDRRGFTFHTDPMEGGQDAYDLSCDALDDARAVLALLSPQDGTVPGAGDHIRGLTKMIQAERAAIATEARRYASHYKPNSDGQNTFILLAEWIEACARSSGEPTYAMARVDAALKIGREAVVESFDHAAGLDDTNLAEARLRDIDDAIALVEK